MLYNTENGESLEKLPDQLQIDDFGDNVAITENICEGASWNLYPWLNTVI